MGKTDQPVPINHYCFCVSDTDFDANPAANISDLRKLWMVIKDGQVITV
jgi:hypothetical protein